MLSVGLKNISGSRVSEYGSRHFMIPVPDPGFCWIWIQSGSRSRPRFFMEISIEFKIFYQKPSYISSWRPAKDTQAPGEDYVLQKVPHKWNPLIFSFFIQFWPDPPVTLIHWIRIRNIELSNIKCYFFRAKDLIRWQQKRLIRIRMKWMKIRNSYPFVTLIR